MTPFKLLDLWQPPAGAGPPVGVVATSFTFETEFFETACLGRFLGLDTHRGEGDALLATIEEEERLAEARVSLVVDRSERPGGRNLRWDLLSVAHPGGLQHAKAMVLVWEDLVRVVIGSANLTTAGYRNQVELAASFDASRAGEVPASFFLEAIAAVRTIVDSAPGEADRSGPKRRALATLADADRRVDKFGLPTRWPRTLRAVVAPTLAGPGAKPLDFIDELFPGSRPRVASVLSPFFDTVDDASTPAVALAGHLAQRGEAGMRFVLPVEQREQLVVRAPKTVAAKVPARVGREFQAYPMPLDQTRLHAKAVVLTNETQVAAMVGSSNFTSAGLGLKARHHLELNVWFVAPLESAEGEALVGLVPKGAVIDPASALWEPAVDDDGALPRVPLPDGFEDCLYDAASREVTVSFAAASLPLEWTIDAGASVQIYDAARWRAEGRPGAVTLPHDAPTPPFFLTVRWDDNGSNEAPWAVNIVDPSALPPPSELRALSVENLLVALASSRPLHEALVAAINKDQRRVDSDRLVAELDPLKRHTADGLFRRTKRLSAALQGLRVRLARPVWSLDTLRWRLRGPFGPLEIAKRLVDEAEATVQLPGESAFAVIEVALTLARTDWITAVTDAVTIREIEHEVDAVLAEMRSLVDMAGLDADLAGYMTAALQEVSR